jgi:hypothetical protein
MAHVSYCGTPELVRETRAAVGESESRGLTSTCVRTSPCAVKYRKEFGFTGCVTLVEVGYLRYFKFTEDEHKN